MNSGTRSAVLIFYRDGVLLVRFKKNIPSIRTFHQGRSFHRFLWVSRFLLTNYGCTKSSLGVAVACGRFATVWRTVWHRTRYENVRHHIRKILCLGRQSRLVVSAPDPTKYSSLLFSYALDPYSRLLSSYPSPTLWNASQLFDIQ